MARWHFDLGPPDMALWPFLARAPGGRKKADSGPIFGSPMAGTPGASGEARWLATAGRGGGWAARRDPQSKMRAPHWPGPRQAAERAPRVSAILSLSDWPEGPDSS